MLFIWSYVQARMSRRGKEGTRYTAGQATVREGLVVSFFCPAVVRTAEGSIGLFHHPNRIGGAVSCSTRRPLREEDHTHESALRNSSTGLPLKL